MATFVTFAELLTSDSLPWKAYVAGIKKNPPGVPIKEILKRTGGIYENKLGMTDKFREQVRTVAQLTGDEELMKIADLHEVAISLEHFRDASPETRIVVGYSLQYTPEESERLGLNREQPLDPRKTLEVTLDPAHPWRVEES